MDVSMQAIITVVGKDQVGIIAGISNMLADHRVNIVDITQSIVKDYFNMFMIVDLSEATSSFKAIKDSFLKCEEELGVEINFQRSEVFETMHRVSGVRHD